MAWCKTETLLSWASSWRLRRSLCNGLAIMVVDVQLLVVDGFSSQFLVEIWRSRLWTREFIMALARGDGLMSAQVLSETFHFFVRVV